jgi:DNA-binding SARP family transcriptional activator/DNA-binding XRE family transcriptional regulator
MDLDRGERAGSLLRSYRQASGLSQRQLAEAARISIGVVRDLEQGRTRMLRNRSAEALALALGLAPGAAGEFARMARGLPPDLRANGNAHVSLRLGVLGPVAAWRAVGRGPGQESLELGPPVQRAVLGLLALSPGELVHREAVIDALWGDDPPASAVNQVQASVSRVRRMLDPGRPPRDTGGLLVSSGTGYRLSVSSGQLDLLSFRDLAGQAETARRAGDAGLACAQYEKALDLWRGDPLADIDALRQHPVVTGLSLRRSAAILGYAEAACSAGWHDRALPLLWPLAEREPLHERAHAALMIALAGTGRQDAALDVFEALRRRLDEQLGVRPGGEVATAHLRLLHGDIPPHRPGPAPATLTGRPARNGREPATRMFRLAVRAKLCVADE